MNERHAINLRGAGPTAVVIATLLLASLVGAQEPELTVRTHLQDMMLDLSQAGIVSTQDGINISVPQRRVRDLGIVIDPAATAQHGMTVVAVTPGGAAQRAELHSGDVLRAVNGHPLHGLSGQVAVATLQQVLDESAKDDFDFIVRRGTRDHELAARVARLQVPAATLSIGESQRPTTAATQDSAGCGRISTVDVAPRQENLHRAQLQLVDGRNAGTTGQEVFRVSSGMHKLTIAENIDSTYLAISDRQRGRALTHKTLMVNVEPDHIYYIAAWLDEAQRQAWATGDYWQPVVWKVAAQRCR